MRTLKTPTSVPRRVDPTSVLNRPALLLALLALSLGIGFALGRLRGALRAALAAVAIGSALLAVKAAAWLPDSGGWFATGIAGAVGAALLAWRLPSLPKR